MSKVSLFPYMGGKQYMVDAILDLVPPHELWCEAMCLTPDTPILSEYGWRPISQINIGDIVLTPKGWKVVSRVIVRSYDGPIYEIKARGIPDALRITPEHPILVIKQPYRGHKKLNKVHGQYLMRNRLAWMPASELTSTHLLVQHFDTTVHNPIAITLPSLKGHTKRQIRYMCPMSYRLMRLVGLFIAEGTIMHSGVGFSQKGGSPLLGFITETMLDIFRVEGKPQIRKEDSMVFLRFHSTQARMFFGQFGDKAKRKYIHSQVMRLPFGFQRGLIRGLFEGDGSYNHRDNGWIYSTSSPQLAKDVYWLLCRQGMMPSFRVDETLTNPSGSSAPVRTVMYRVNVWGQGRVSMNAIMNNNTYIPSGDKGIKQYHLGVNLRRVTDKGHHMPSVILRRIESIKMVEEGESTVYNLEVEGEPAYITNIATVHNCGSSIVTLAKPRSKNEVINDRWDEVYNTYVQVQQDFHAVLQHFMPCGKYSLWHRRIYEETAREFRNGVAPEDQAERAARFIYLAVASFTGHLGAGWRHSKLKNAALDLRYIKERITIVAERLQYIQIESRDVVEVINFYDSPTAFTYIDPPYSGVQKDPDVKSGFTYYGHKFIKEDHERVAECLHNIKGKAMVSYYPHPLTDELYKDWWRLEFERPKYSSSKDEGSTKDIGIELLFLNYPPPVQQSSFLDIV